MQRLLELSAAVAPIREQRPQRRAACRHLLQQVRCLTPILDTRSMHVRRQRVPFCVRNKVAFAPLDYFAGIVPARVPRFGGLGALAVDRSRCRLFRAACISSRRASGYAQNSLSKSRFDHA